MFLSERMTCSVARASCRGRLLAGRRLDGHDEQSAPLDVLLGLGDLALDDLVDVAAEAVAGVVALDGRQEGVLAERVSDR